MNLTDLTEHKELRKHCPWDECAHGMGVAARGSCYAGGDPDDPVCKEFITDEEWERRGEKMSGGDC